MSPAHSKSGLPDNVFLGNQPACIYCRIQICKNTKRVLLLKCKWRSPYAIAAHTWHERDYFAWRHTNVRSTNSNFFVFTKKESTVLTWFRTFSLLKSERCDCWCYAKNVCFTVGDIYLITVPYEVPVPYIRPNTGVNSGGHVTAEKIKVKIV